MDEAVFYVKDVEEFLELLNEEYCMTANLDLMFDYVDEKEPEAFYMFQAPHYIAKEMRKEDDVDFLYACKDRDLFSKTIQEYHSWAELYENATFQDGVKFKDAILQRKVLWR